MMSDGILRINTVLIKFGNIWNWHLWLLEKASIIS